jgi:hypothetical protein
VERSQFGSGAPSGRGDRFADHDRFVVVEVEKLLGAESAQFDKALALMELERSLILNRLPDDDR